MTMNPLPPQAYTKDILLKAYQWLMGQNSSIKEMATTPDILVSLYLKATRDGDHALDRPSIQNFKNELRSLAGMMGELDRTPHVHHQPMQQVLTARTQMPAAPIAAPVQTVVATPAAPVQAAPVQPQAIVMPATVAPVVTAPPVQATQTRMSYTEKTMTTTTLASEPLEALDCATKLMIQEVKDEFNLSSDLESLRMLVKIGYTRSRTMLS